MRVILSDGQVRDCQDEPAHEGAEGRVYISSDSKSVIKLYFREASSRRSTLDAIIGRLNAVAGVEYWRDYMCWPEAIVVSPQLGIVMPKAPDDLRKLDWFINQKARRVLTTEQRGTWDGYVLMALRLARAVARLHQLGLCHSDLSVNNCLADARTGRIRLIDLDGLVVPGLLPPTVLGTDGYRAPELVLGKDRPSIYTDRHSLAVLIHQLLLFRHPLRGPKFHSPDPVLDDQLAEGREALYAEHPRDTSNRPRGKYVSSGALGTAVAQLMEQAFVTGLHSPSERPQPAYWEEALCRLYDRLLPCANPDCQMKFFPLAENQPLQCPWCGTNWAALPTLAVLELFRPVSGRRGQFSPDHYSVLAHPDRPLFEWHAYPGKSPGPQANPTPLASFEYDGTGRWILHNKSANCFVALVEGQARRDVRPGDAVVLSDQLRVLLGPENQARLALVRLLPVRADSRG